MKITMKNYHKLIRYLLDNYHECYSINSIAKKLKLNYRIAFEEINKLANEKIIIIKRMGNSNQCTFNYYFNEKVLEVEQKKREELLKNKDIKVLYSLISDIKNPFYICLIFGSYAQGKQTKNSDIDVCIISDNKEINAEIEQITKTLPLKIHLLDFTCKEFISMLKTTELNVGKEIVKNRVLLKGAENFYELINHA